MASNPTAIIEINSLDTHDSSKGNDSVDNRITTTPSMGTPPPTDMLKHYYYGCGSCRPKVVQIFANKKFFTFLMSLCTVLHGSVVQGFVSVNISSLETRYSFSSTLAGLYVIMYEVVTIFAVVFVSYFGGKLHKPKVLAISLVIFGIGNLVTASPQFLFGPYIDRTNTTSYNYEQCTTGDSPPIADDDCSSTNIGAYVVLLIGQALIGIGEAPTFTVGIAYIDEIVYPKYVSLHICTLILSTLLGVAIGFTVGSGLLTIYVDPWLETNLVPDDPSWVGAWWIGPLLMGVISLCLSFLLFMFPKWLPDSHLVRIERAKEMAKTYTSDLVHDNNLTLIVKQFPVQIKQLLTNVSFMSTSFALAMIFIVIDGVVTFGPKYIESMFRVTATSAGLLTGIIGVSAAGIVIGSGAVYLWKPKGYKTGIIQFIAVSVCIPFCFALLIKCQSINIAGIFVPYSDGSFDGRDSSMCFMNCSCTSSVYEPVCGDDGITYFSPCRAGCSNIMKMEDGSQSFSNCSCIILSPSLDPASSSSLNITDTAKEGECQDGCSYQLIIFLVIVFVFISLLNTIDIPYYYYTLRVVADDQRHLALGLQSAIFRIFGSIPGPLLFGAIIDLACVEWDYNCGIRGNCWIYDNDKLSLNIVALCVPFVILCAVLLFVAIVTYPARKANN